MAALRGEKEDDKNTGEERKLKPTVRTKRVSMGRKIIFVKCTERCVPNASAR